MFCLPRTQRRSFLLDAHIKEMNLAFLGYLKPQSFGCLLDTGKTLWRFIFYSLYFVMQDVKSATWVQKEMESHKILANHSISCSTRNLWEKEEKGGCLTLLEHPSHRREREANIPSGKQWVSVYTEQWRGGLRQLNTITHRLSVHGML